MKTEVKRYRLRSMPKAHCLVHIFTEGEVITDVVLESYRTDVIVIDLDFNEVTCTGTYSNSTRKQIGRFINEFTLNEDYYTMKELSNKPLQFKYLTLADSDYARKIAKEYLENEKPLSQHGYTSYVEECKKAMSKYYF